MSLVSAVRDLQDAPAPDFITRPAIAALFGDNGGEEWAVSHYRLKAA
jgi:hypothetical protein